MMKTGFLDLTTSSIAKHLAVVKCEKVCLGHSLVFLFVCLFKTKSLPDHLLSPSSSPSIPRWSVPNQPCIKEPYFIKKT